MDRKQFRQTAAALTGNPGFKRLALYSAGAVAAANILLLLLQLLTDRLIQNATGLDGLSKRSGILTMQSVLDFAISIAAPFWSFGFYKVAMDIARNNQPETKTLLFGFQRFWPLLRLLILEILTFFCLAMLGGMAASMLYVNTPLSNALMKYIPTLEAAEQLTDPEAIAALIEPILPSMILDMLPLFLLVFLAIGVLVIPWAYKIRLAHYHVLDGLNHATVAMALSKQEMRGSRFALFKLDLSWWWYYLLLMLTSAPQFLPKIPLLVSAILTFGLQVLVQWLFMARVETSYALAYDWLRFKTPQTESPTDFPNA